LENAVKTILKTLEAVDIECDVITERTFYAMIFTTLYLCSDNKRNRKQRMKILKKRFICPSAHSEMETRMMDRLVNNLC
jgi:hypothetical protein